MLVAGPGGVQKCEEHNRLVGKPSKERGIPGVNEYNLSIEDTGEYSPG